MTDGKITGRDVATIFIGAFSVIIAVNVALAVSAVRTFPGLEVRNSYVASQSFDADRRAQENLGWSVSATLRDRALVLRIEDASGPVPARVSRATLGRATHTGADRELDFRFERGAYRAALQSLAPGNWNLRLEAMSANGTLFRQRIVLRVPE